MPKGPRPGLDRGEPVSRLADAPCRSPCQNAVFPGVSGGGSPHLLASFRLAETIFGTVTRQFGRFLFILGVVSAKGLSAVNGSGCL
jgi:hypothetical protein